MQMLERDHEQVPLIRQCELVGVARSSVYYRPKDAVSNLHIMHRLDELFTAHPFLGYRKLAAMVRLEGYAVGRERVRRLLRQMGLMAIYQSPNTSKAHPENRIYPYLLKHLAIVRPNQVWATDITYIRMQKGWCYLVAIIDWYSRAVLAWRLSNTMETGFCLEALEAALEQHSAPDIFNSDQGSQFTSERFTDRLKAADIRISMDGRGSYQDNIFTERLWRSVKYEEVYLREYTSITIAEQYIGEYFMFYNHRRPHQALGYKTPWNLHFALAKPMAVDMMDNSEGELPTSPQQTHQQPCGALDVKIVEEIRDLNLPPRTV
jgi:putative transposase